jgi:hypothetical protein
MEEVKGIEKIVKTSGFSKKGMQKIYKKLLQINRT